MSYLDAIILGLVQGLTEFLPVSSSGHLVIAENLLHAKIPGVLFELAVHFGTLMSVVIYFRRKILDLIKSLFIPAMKKERAMVFYLCIGTIPAVIIAILLKDSIEQAFSSPLVTSILLLVTGLILFSTAIPRRNEKDSTIGNSIMVGIGQALAIFPGISRSGTSISFGLFSGLKPVAAAEFSFLLSIPAIIGAIVFKANEIATVNPAMIGQYILGTTMSFLSGLAAVYFLLDIIRKGKFEYFGIYCTIVGFGGIIIFG
nr:undecaprenyl-diphosphate phosphatase [candidate division Zixibacteria bacterium]